MKDLFKRIGFWTASLVTLLMLALAAPANAADDDRSGTFLTPFPDNDVYQVTVFGDEFAEGLLGGLLQAFNGDVRLNIQRQVSPISGISGVGFEAKVAALERAIGAQPFNIAVVMVGENDRISIRSADGELTQRMNDVIRERAYLNGYKYIDTYQGFTGDNGSYSAYGPDLEGAIRLLRLRDGVNFTDAGNRKLAHFVEKELRSDLMQAKSNRNTPLLGAEAEQEKINPGNTVKTPAPSSPVAAKQDPGKPPVVRGSSLDGTPPSSTSTASGDQKSDNGKIVLKVAGSNGREETQTIEILRPAIPASVVALMARREGSGQRGDLLVDQIAGGLTLMSSITPSDGKERGKLSPTQAPYFRLLVKGERLQPKPGRADDVTWPPKNGTTSEANPADPPPRG